MVRKELDGLSGHVRAALSSMVSGPVVRQSMNPGVSNKLVRDGLVEVVMLASPYRTHKGKAIEHLGITEEGLKKLNGKSTSTD